MMWVGVVMHATFVFIISFFVLFAASKSEGLVKLFGTILGLLLFVVAVLHIVGALTAPMFGGKPFGMDMHGMHDHWMHHWDHGGQPDMGPPPNGPQPPAPGSH
jgi:hypothetical protein